MNNRNVVGCYVKLNTNIFVPGTAFLCSVLVAPVKTDNGSVVMYIVNHEDVTWSPNTDEVIPKRK